MFLNECFAPHDHTVVDVEVLHSRGPGHFRRLPLRKVAVPQLFGGVVHPHHQIPADARKNLIGGGCVAGGVVFVDDSTERHIWIRLVGGVAATDGFESCSLQVPQYDVVVIPGHDEVLRLIGKPLTVGLRVDLSDDRRRGDPHSREEPDCGERRRSEQHQRHQCCQSHSQHLLLAHGAPPLFAGRCCAGHLIRPRRRFTAVLEMAAVQLHKCIRGAHRHREHMFCARERGDLVEVRWWRRRVWGRDVGA